jgi:branched-chain amino acid aminotransferase
MWRGGTLVTPPLSCAALPGITRAAVLELARASGMPAEERAFRLGELLTADEAFLTSSLRGLVPLVRVGDKTIGSGLPGDVTRRLAGDYTALVDRECGA